MYCILYFMDIRTREKFSTRIRCYHTNLQSLPDEYTLGIEDGLHIFYWHKTRKKLVMSKMSDGLLKVFLCVWDWEVNILQSVRKLRSSCGSSAVGGYQLQEWLGMMLSIWPYPLKCPVFVLYFICVQRVVESCAFAELRCLKSSPPSCSTSSGG
jgi:hypothetical protein